MRKRVKRFILKEEQQSGIVAKWWVWDIKLSPNGREFVWSWQAIVTRQGRSSKEGGVSYFNRLTDKEVSKSLYKELKRVGYWDYILAEDLK